MRNQYLMPANSKKSMLIFGLFTYLDLIVLGSGIIITVIAMLVLQNPPLWMLLLAITPLLVSAGLVFPVPHYHNILQFITNVVSFFVDGRKYYWRGWCLRDVENDK